MLDDQSYMIECILKCLLLRFLTTFYSFCFFFQAVSEFLQSRWLVFIRLFAKTNNPRIANKQNWYKKKSLPFHL